ncbi:MULTISPECIES: hypothetical protein [Bradyrhizobium]|uniref:hypothetical protein n=1 Tax=Bradyrhizobium TaxID=374 RepID=UPI001F0A55F6|nr:MULTISPECIES: hypothetical protein [Bradyrhizobium]
MKDLAGISRRQEERHARGGRLLAAGDLLEIGDTGRQEPRPATSGRRRILTEKMIGRDLQGRPGAQQQNGKRGDDGDDVSLRPDTGE